MRAHHTAPRAPVFEDDVILSDNFTAALSEALDTLPDDWDVLLLGALGAVHPAYYAVNVGHAVLAGGCRWPRGARKAFRSPPGQVAIHTPLRPFGTHAYALSERGARKLLARAPKANYHVDVVAWGMRNIKLFAVHPLLAKQTHDDTTIGGSSDRSWLPQMVIDQCARHRPAPHERAASCSSTHAPPTVETTRPHMRVYICRPADTGTDFAWAWNAPLMQFGGQRGMLVTSGRAFFMSFVGLLFSMILRSKLVLAVTLGWGGGLYSLLTLLTWPQRRSREPNLQVEEPPKVLSA